MTLPKSIRQCWREMSDLSIYDATFWMVHESDPEQHTYRCETDQEFALNYSDNTHGEQAVYEKSEVILSAIRAKNIKTTTVKENGIFFDITKTYILKSDWINWCRQNNYTALSNLFNPSTNQPAIATSVIHSHSTPTQNLPPTVIPKLAPLNPWNVADPKDPSAVQSWYTSARYFAREQIRNDATLLTKRDLLAKKVAQSLSAVGIYKRGGKLPLSETTILKAFSNVVFS
jgi:hypothetical protein